MIVSHLFSGVHIINLKKTYEKLLLAARAIASIENPADVYVISSRPMGQRAVLKYARYTGATSIAGRFTPGAFTNQIQVGTWHLSYLAWSSLKKWQFDSCNTICGNYYQIMFLQFVMNVRKFIPFTICFLVDLWNCSKAIGKQNY